ncbi:uncharacterized protein LOC135077903 [Ostrinia nubilalis]|uniref:uncharacterized protein LOC135077903 n=1 Tax=Ostrinia nubilalis TaxID=29057 RepID=UPI003082392D
MLVFKIAPVFLLVLTVGAEKKIELQDIEEDNLKSEKEKDSDKSEPRSEAAQPGLPLEFLKNGLLRYFEAPTHQEQPQQPRYVQQYAVTEAPERPPTAAPKAQYGPPTAQQAMVGYLSNVPMQIYLVPQYYSDQSEQNVNAQNGVQYHTAPAVTRVAYPTAPEAVQTQTNYIEVPTYVTPTGKTYQYQQYSSPVTYVSYTPQPTVATAQATVAPVLAYQMPVVQYPTAIVAPPVAKGYYQPAQFSDTNAVDDTQENEEEPQKQYPAQTESPHTKSPDYPRYYSARQPFRDEYRHNAVPELPPPNPLLLKGHPPHLSHIPKALPMYRPLHKPVYNGGGFISNGYSPRPPEAYNLPFKRRPTSLLDSYIPSSLQIEYLKRGYSKDPLQVYEALATGRHYNHAPVTPRHYERGFLPNQMYHTAAGGVTYGHYKRATKADKAN